MFRALAVQTASRRHGTGTNGRRPADHRGAPRPRRRRSGPTTLAVLVVLGLSAPTTAGAQGASASAPWTTRTTVTGGWQGTPPVVPRMIDLDTATMSVVGQYTLHGAWTGIVYFTSDDVRVDRVTGDYTFTTEATFVGSWVEDGSTGSITWNESVVGNVLTGETKASLEITGSSGDPSFGCSSGTLMWVGYANPATSFGGYTGTWQHGCRTPFAAGTRRAADATGA